MRRSSRLCVFFRTILCTRSSISSSGSGSLLSPSSPSYIRSIGQHPITLASSMFPDFIFFATSGRKKNFLAAYFFLQKTTQNLCYLCNFMSFYEFFSSENNANFFIIYVIFLQIHVIYAILCVNRLLLLISKCGKFHFFLRNFFASKTAVAEFLYKYKIWPFLDPITQFNPSYISISPIHLS